MSNAELIATDPGWIILVKGLLVFATCVVLTLLAIWAERRIVARMQERPGPNRVGPLGLLQSLSDGVKLAHKEDLIPAAAAYAAAEAEVFPVEAAITACAP